MHLLYLVEFAIIIILIPIQYILSLFSKVKVKEINSIIMHHFLLILKHFSRFILNLTVFDRIGYRIHIIIFKFWR